MEEFLNKSDTGKERLQRAQGRAEQWCSEEIRKSETTTKPQEDAVGPMENESIDIEEAPDKETSHIERDGASDDHENLSNIEIEEESFERDQSGLPPRGEIDSEEMREIGEMFGDSDDDNPTSKYHSCSCR